MTAFVVLLALIFLKLYAWNRDSKAKRSVRHACFFCCLRYCQDSPPKGEIWIYFFVWSCLSAAAEAQRQDLIELRTFIENNKQDFKNSDHSYYTPSHDTTNKSCINNTLLCYILEAQVINYETRGGRSITILEAMTEEIRSLFYLNFSITRNGVKRVSPYCEGIVTLLENVCYDERFSTRTRPSPEEKYRAQLLAVVGKGKSIQFLIQQVMSLSC